MSARKFRVTGTPAAARIACGLLGSLFLAIGCSAPPSRGEAGAAQGQPDTTLAAPAPADTAAPAPASSTTTSSDTTAMAPAAADTAGRAGSDQATAATNSSRTSSADSTRAAQIARAPRGRPNSSRQDSMHMKPPAAAAAGTTSAGSTAAGSTSAGAAANQEGPPPQILHDKYHPAPHDTISETAYQGWKQFELNCARCHGEFGVGSSFAPALVNSLKSDGPIPTKAIFVATVCAGRPAKGMPSWCALGMEPQTMNEIYEYLKGRADGKIGVGRPAVKSGT
ncbi:MAG TPA: cytochrome c [Gemmatimonadales bacterium]|nr:cytochrome c [Gemmatimonadales bacterium]